MLSSSYVWVFGDSPATKNRCGLISLAAGLSDTNEKSPKSTGRLDLISKHEKVW